jgi:hypothetical protein
MAKVSTTARVPAKKGEAHHSGFDRAFDEALSQLSSEIGTGHYAVSVKFGADVEVTNPGKVGFYKVMLTKP